ncbi:MAG: carbon-nitrogen hydrolase family protein [Candidatus Glassbacteria bacterium]|nr:carbon-nitrogen hydrolase family protein [Candidatus Glassbacteria bacterium]
MKSGGISRRNFIRAGAGSLGALAISSSSAAAGTDEAMEGSPAEGKVRIAVVQQETVPGAVDENRSKALGFASEALEKGADIVLFHEELLVGYVENLKFLAEEVDGPTSREFRKLLAGSGSLVLWGLTERAGSKFYISATLVGAAGVLANYHKTHLWWKAEGLRHEPAFYEPGDELVTFEVKGHKSGVMICYDGDFPEMTRAYANLDCRMLFWLNNRGSRGHEEVTKLAENNSMIMAASCCCGNNELGYKCRGGSNITDCDGSLVCEIWDKEGVIYADVEPGKVPEARSNNPWYTGRRGELYCRYEL